MKYRVSIFVVLVLLFFYTADVFSQVTGNAEEINFTSFSAFRDPGSNWKIAGSAEADPAKKHDLNYSKGNGVAVNDFSRNDRMHLITLQEYGDVELEMDFMMANNSNAGVYLQGRYEVQLLDSWKKNNPSSSDLGGIYMRWQPGRGTFEGTPPSMNVARAPGLWQHLFIRFKAAKYDPSGKKTEHARFDLVSINGIKVQQNVVVTVPTGSSIFNDEKPLGPLVIQGDHGPLALRNLKIKKLDADFKPVDAKREWWDVVDPVQVHTGARTTFVRAFAEHENKKLTHAIFFGSKEGVNFSYNLKQGSIIGIWRGHFLDMTRAWHGRGEPQVATPLGSVIHLPNALLFNTLENSGASWKDTALFDSVLLKGFTLNKDRCPAFRYSLAGANVLDSIFFTEGGDGISRVIRIDRTSDNTYFRLAAGTKIETLPNDLYAINDKSYYIRIEKKFKPFIRNSTNGQELLVKYSGVDGIAYSFVW